MPAVIPRTPASAMSATSHPSKQPLLSSHEQQQPQQQKQQQQRSSSSHSLSPSSALSSSISSAPHSHYTKPNTTTTTLHPTNTRRALHYNTPQSALSPRSTTTPLTSTTTPLTSTTPSTTSSSTDLLDLDSWQFDTESQLERLIINAELVLSQEKQRAHLGLLNTNTKPHTTNTHTHAAHLTAHTADTFDQLDDSDARELRDLIAQAKRLEHGVNKELVDIQRSVAEEKENTNPNTTKHSDTHAAGSEMMTYASIPTSTLHRVREMNEYITVLEAKVEDLQIDIEKQKSSHILSTIEKNAKNVLKQQLVDEQAKYDALEDKLQNLQVEYRNVQQSNAELIQRLDDVSGSYDSSEVMFSEEKERSSRWLKEREEVKADKRTLEEKIAQLTQRESVVRGECDRRLSVVDSVRRDGTRVKVMGVLFVGLAVLLAGVDRWMSEYVRSQPHLYTF